MLVFGINVYARRNFSYLIHTVLAIFLTSRISPYKWSYKIKNILT